MVEDDAKSDVSSRESAWSDAEETEVYEFKAFHDDRVFDSLPAMLEHEVQVHDFDLDSIRKDLHLDLYASIKLVNYVRSTKATTRQIQTNIDKISSDDSLLQPFLENDAVLFHLVDLENADETDWQTKYHDLASQYAQMQVTLRKAIDARSQDSSSAAVADQKIDNDSYYFNSYGYNDIHETMLKDRTRTDAYRDFVYDNKDIFKDKVVLDVGCGTGILGMFCAKAGAKHVYAIDNSNIIDKARSNAYENGLDDAITFIKGKVEDIKLPVEQVDIIISEWMGYALLYESMLDSVIHARDRFLAPDGLMAPSQTTLLISGLSDKDYFDDRVNFWNDVYGFKMGAMKDGIFDDVLMDTLQDKSLGTRPFVFNSLDLQKSSVEDLMFTAPFILQPLQGHEEIIALQIWFDTFFTRKPQSASSHREPVISESGAIKLPDGNAFSTGPHGTPTHWKQATLLLDGSIKTNGRPINGTITYAKDSQNPRFLDIRVTYAHPSTKQEISQVWHLT